MTVIPFSLNSTQWTGCPYYAILPIDVEFSPGRRRLGLDPQLRRHVPQRAEGPAPPGGASGGRHVAPVGLRDQGRDDGANRPVRLGGAAPPRRLDARGLRLSPGDERCGGGKNAIYQAAKTPGWT